MEFVEKQCVGCGYDYLCFKDYVDTSLYCTSSCKENHSLFSDEDRGNMNSFMEGDKRIEHESR